MAAENQTRGMKKLRPLSELTGEEPPKQQTQPELPLELLQTIISQLTLRDNIRASVVCKSWLKAAISVRKADKPPLLMIFPKFGSVYEFYDPLKRKSDWHDLPDLDGSRIRCSKHGWLLLYKPDDQIIFFFSPFTRDLIKLPYMDLTTGAVAFSAAPTSPNCILFTVKNVDDDPILLTMSTWRPGNTEWTIVSYQTGGLPFVCNLNKIVFYNGLFHCLSVDGMLGIYNPETVSWTFYYYMGLPSLQNNFFLAEHNGDLYVIVTDSFENPFVIKLDPGNDPSQSHMKSLGGMTFFVNCLSSLAKTDFLGTMRDKVYFSKVLFYGKHCVSYSVDKGRYYPRNQFYNWGDQQDLTSSIWIEQPQSHITSL